MDENVDVKSKHRRLRQVRQSLIEKLRNSDLTDIARLSGALSKDVETEAGSLIVEYLGKPVTVDPFAGKITVSSEDWRDCGGPLRVAEEIFILHYLFNATGKKPTGNFVPFRSMDGGFFYDSVFQGRTINRFVRAFCDREERLLDICGILGGTPSGMSG